MLAESKAVIFKCSRVSKRRLNGSREQSPILIDPTNVY